MTKSVLQKLLIILALLASGIVLSTQVMSQEMDTLLPGMTLDSFKKVEGENKLRLRQLNGSSSNESLSVKISSNSIIWNSWGIGQTTENFKDSKSGYTFDMITQFMESSSPHQMEPLGPQETLEPQLLFGVSPMVVAPL